MSKHQPLERRTFRYKRPSVEFFCPLCSTKRAITSHPHLKLKNYFQIGLLTLMSSMALWSLMSWRSFFLFFIYWSLFEGTRRVLFRKEVPCPHCGFDASWYKRDVKVARELVHHFWENKNSDKEESSKDIAESL